MEAANSQFSAEAVELREDVLAQAPMMRVEGLRHAFGGQTVLDGVSLELRRGEVALLRGVNGSGKTTLLNILTGNLQPDAGVVRLAANGDQKVFEFPQPWRRRFNPFDHFSPESVAREGVGRSWQETRLFSTQSLQSNIAVASPGQMGENPLWAVLRPFSVRRQETRLLGEVSGMLEDLGLAGREASSAGMVSLGQSKRVAIARAVQAGAKILFLDEPLSGLDAAGIAGVMEMLQRLARRENLTLVIVEHLFNIPRILDFATTVWTLDRGQLAVQDPAEVRAEMEHQAVAGLPAWVREIAGLDSRVIKERLTGGAVLERIAPHGSPADAGEAVLEVEDLVVYRGKRLVLGQEEADGTVRGLSFTLRHGELSVLRAPNGWGKTTLMEVIAGLIPVTRGYIRLLGKPLEKWPAWERRRLGLSLLQARGHTFPALTVRETLRLAGVKDVPEGLESLMDKRACDLSGGEKQKVALASALASGHFVVGLLDEPFGALDTNAVERVSASLAVWMKETALLVAVPDAVESVWN